MPTYRAKTEKWGDGLGLRLLGDAVRSLGLRVGSEVELVVLESQFALKPPPKLTPGELFRGKSDAEWRAVYRECEFDWGPDVGREIIRE